MANFNRVILMGNLTRDPQLSYTPQNTAVCKFGMAVNRRWRDREGATREEVCFVDCTLFGAGAETFKKYMAKGRAVLIEGRLQFQQWTTPEGDKRSKHEVIVENFNFVGGGRGEGADAGRPAGRSAGGPGGAPMDEDIPEVPSGEGIPF